MENQTAGSGSRRAMRFVPLVGILSFFADFTYEGARSILGPFLAAAGASATIIGVVVGFGELLGYGLRVVSGRMADATRRFWPITIFGYIVQMAAVPALALTHSWQAAACLIILERVGKAIRNPPRDVMLASAAQRIGGYGWAFGIHEACDQFGAMVGPLAVAAVLATRDDYRLAFAVLAVPAVFNLCFLTVARLVFPRPQDMEQRAAGEAGAGSFPALYWVYLGGAGLVAAGFADYPLIAYHWVKHHTLTTEWIPIFYAVAMAVSGGASLALGRLFDRYGFKVLIGLTGVSLLFAPLVFLGGSFGLAILGAALWGMGMGVHESIIPAAVAPMVAQSRRASAFGMFTAVYGVCWFAGSALIGWIYDQSVIGAVAFCVITQAMALPAFVCVSWRREKG
ncbi:Major Facilitator Superfamily protein [Paraburkholderia phenazinium]|uniref:Major Facilitator Superfamily protein n=1 Tax=Paraburkholderia phenazinium TaxID=60549 RepID=A0A1G7NSP0_9BURK|nr:MFS transporter [Paraburkholderia phenazinium]MDR3388136.1 MFS transporter [Rudaea sp.]SDF77006.1 Major Facilitator Superfamily protein [Paraburkholderia phenazinium]